MVLLIALPSQAFFPQAMRFAIDAHSDIIHRPENRKIMKLITSLIRIALVSMCLQEQIEELPSE